MRISVREIGHRLACLVGLAAVPSFPNIALAQQSTIGWDWVRSNPIFVSSLVVDMVDPPTGWMDTYFNTFGATALHLWRRSADNELLDWLARDPATPYVVWVEVDGTVDKNSDVIADCGANVGCIGFQVGDEPANIFEMNAIADGIAAIHAIDPNAIAIINVLGGNPRFRHIQAAERADILSTTNYDTNDVKAWRARASARTAALSNGIPYWTYLDTGGDPGDLAYRAMASLAVGYTGITWFVYQLPDASTGHESAQPYMNFFAAAGDYAAPTTANFVAAAEVNRWVEVLGRSMTQLTNTSVTYVSDGRTPFMPFPDWRPSANVPLLAAVDRPDGGDWLVSTFRDGEANIYYTVLNARHPEGDTPGTTGAGDDRVTLTFDLPPGTVIRILDQEDGTIIEEALDANSQISFVVPAGQLRLFTVEGHPFAGIEPGLACAADPVGCHAMSDNAVIARTAGTIAGVLDPFAGGIGNTGPSGQYYLNRFGRTGADGVVTFGDGTFAMWANRNVERYRQGFPGGKINGGAGMIQGGFDYVVNGRLIIGLAAEGQSAREASEGLNYQIESRGWMAGPYAALRVGENFVVDAKLLWGRSHNDLQPFRTYSDNYVSDSWLAAVRLSGEVALRRLLLRPEIGFTHVERTQREYVDNNDVTIPEHSSAYSQLTFGFELALHLPGDAGRLQPSIRLYGDWDRLTGQFITRLEGALRMNFDGGASVSLVVGYGCSRQLDFADFNVSAGLTIPLQQRY